MSATARERGSVGVFGIRHHGPGSARSLMRALEAFGPDALLVEGPADADGVLPLAGAKGMRPPVALVVYPPDRPGRGAFYPFASFSPEWNALHFALSRGIPARFCDLPRSLELADESAAESAAESDEEGAAEGAQPPPDPIRLLAEAAGEYDPERWWERLVEQRHDDADVFAAVLEAMAAVREGWPDLPPREARREAHMRQAIRRARKEGFERVAVVCGAWHAPALDVHAFGAAADDALLRGLKRMRTDATWVPWTNQRLARENGYAAGVESPAWYRHLWETGGDLVAWLTAAARLLREEDLDASPAQVVEAVRMAETLAALRGRPRPSLTEASEATLAVLCGGEEARLRLIRRALVVGQEMGALADGVPSVPLQRDLEAEARRLRLKLHPDARPLQLDLRQPAHLEQSQLLHRLALLGVGWGRLERLPAGRQGTFHEHWTLAWRPELALRVIEVGAYGHTVSVAAAARAVELAEGMAALAALAELLQGVLRAGLDDVAPALVALLGARSAASTDVSQMLRTLPALAAMLRYGDVRRTDRGALAALAHAVAERAIAGLGPACAGVDDETARALASELEGASRALGLLEDEPLVADWWAALARLADLPDLHGLLGGTCCRLLLGAERMTDADAGERLAFSLSRGAQPAVAAQWFEGFLRQTGLLLAVSDRLFGVVDRWLLDLSPQHFLQVLPLLRRTTSTFAAGERRQIAARVRSGGAVQLGGVAGDTLDAERAALVEPVVLRLLGVGP